MQRRDRTVVEVLGRIGPIELRITRRLMPPPPPKVQGSGRYRDGERTPVQSAIDIIANLAAAEARKKNPKIAWVLRDVVRRMEARAHGEKV